MIRIKMLAAVAATMLLFACNSNQHETVKKPLEQAIADTATNSGTADTMRTIVNRSMIWTVQPQDSARQKLRPPDSLQVKNYSVQQLVGFLNDNYPDIQMKFEKISNDTVYVKIPDSGTLANEIGDTGAENYLASATFTLTEIKNVRYVHIAMKAGDHAEPGVYSRQDFKELR